MTWYNWIWSDFKFTDLLYCTECFYYGLYQNTACTILLLIEAQLEAQLLYNLHF